MSKKISMDILLPVALELFKTVPAISVVIKPHDETKHSEMALDLAERFATFCLHLQQKLEEQDEM